MSSWRNNRSRASGASAVSTYSAKTKRLRRQAKLANRLTKAKTRTYAGVPISSVSFSAVGVGFPDMLYMTHNYEERVGVSAPGDMNTNRQYRFMLNGMFDPNVTGTGFQPALYDNMGAIYTRYRVYAADVKVTFVSYTNDFTRVGFYATETNDTSAAGLWAQNTFSLDGLKSNRVAYKMLGAYATLSATPQMCVIKKKFDFRQLLGEEVMTDSDFTAPTGSNPAKPFYLSVGGNNMFQPGVTNALHIEARVSIRFHTLWDELIVQEQVADD
ncbi:MAG: putative capsid protein [Cressdnaviricota sp.]|nr:MAG: putative capsid protein [Cressdnaviricota sp.]